MWDNIRAERVRSGMTVEELAEAIGARPSLVQAWEQGDAEPYASDLVRLSRLFGCSPDYLLGLEGRNGVNDGTNASSEPSHHSCKPHAAPTDTCDTAHTPHQQQTPA